MNHCCPCLLKSLLPRLSRLVTEITPKTQNWLQGLPTTLFFQGMGWGHLPVSSPPQTKQQQQKQNNKQQHKKNCKLSHDNLSRLSMFQIKCNQSLIYISIFMGVLGAKLRTQLLQEFLAYVIDENRSSEN